MERDPEDTGGRDLGCHNYPSDGENLHISLLLFDLPVGIFHPNPIGHTHYTIRYYSIPIVTLQDRTGRTGVLRTGSSYPESHRVQVSVECE